MARQYSLNLKFGRRSRTDRASVVVLSKNRLAERALACRYTVKLPVGFLRDESVKRA